jgi:hypothetical protein
MEANAKPENLSRRELLKWVNSTLQVSTGANFS